MTALVDRAAGFLESRLSRRSFINRSAYAGSAVAIGAGLDLALRPGTAYGAICTCGGTNCNCGSTCCAGFTEFCCSINDGYNYCPTGSLLGGWWKADNSSYCGEGPRYYMDCHAQCSCTTGCGGGWGFCEPGCDGETCGCGANGCNSYVTNCFQFRYGQCNQHVSCIGRIRCRVVACVPPWEIDPSCTTSVAVDESTAEQNQPCWTPAFPTPPPPPTPTKGDAIALAASADGGGYALATGWGALFPFGNFPSLGDESAVGLTAPIVGLAATPSGRGYWLVASDGGIFTFGDAPFLGSMGGIPLDRPVVGMAATPSGRGYWLVASDGGIFTFGDAPFLGSMGGVPLAEPVMAMAPLLLRGRTGYWLVASDGGIFTFGDAPYLGSMVGSHLDAPVSGMAPTPSGSGYWMVARDGGIFTFGDAPFLGSPA